jgi:hypothetical protein
MVKRARQRRRILEVGVRASFFNLRGFAAQIPVGLFVTGIVVGTRSGVVFPTRFYEISAQVIPVVLLVLAFELRVFQYQPRFMQSVMRQLDSRMDEAVGAYRRYLAYLNLLIVLAALITGEMLALFCIAFEHSGGSASQGVVLGALMSGFGLIGYAAVVGVRRRSREAEDLTLTRADTDASTPYDQSRLKI